MGGDLAPSAPLVRRGLIWVAQSPRSATGPERTAELWAAAVDSLMATFERNLPTRPPTVPLGVSCGACGCLLRPAEVCPACRLAALGPVLLAELRGVAA